MIKRLLRRWLEIPDQSDSQDHMRMRGLYQSVSANYGNTLHEITELNKKLEVLCETLGIVIIGSTNEDGPKIVSVKQDGMLGDARSYINAAQTAEKVINIQYQCLQEQARLFAKLNRKN